ncbi:MAG TPA: YidB family protein [Xanthobacteraceae bacterium]|jgi:uncharacterized protein YidB (DUF937 family)
MGLLDVLNGMQNGPRGAPAPSGGNSSGGMSPITMALLGLLAYKAIKHFNPGQPADSSGGTSAPSGGGLGGLLQGGLGGLLAGGAGAAAAGGALSGGLGDLLKQFQQSGHGDTAKSWVGDGANKAISPNDLASALGGDQINALMEQSGMSRSELLSGLSQNLPELVDKLTPDGRLPTAEEAGRML